MRKEISINVDLKVDTGFNGVIGLTQTYINDLQLQDRGTTRVISAMGQGTLEFYEIEFSIPNTTFTELKAIAIKTPRSLIGRTILNLGSWLYD